MVNQTRAGINYTAYPDCGIQFILNKLLLILGTLFIYFYNSFHMSVVSIVVLCVPLIKKCVIALIGHRFSSECILVLSSTLLHLALSDIQSAVMMLIVYHIFDFIVYIFYARKLNEFFETSILFEKTINYRFNGDGDYILSNNEYIPVEGVVVSGNALMDIGRVVGTGNEYIPVHTGDKLLPACRIIKGNIVYRPLKNTDNSVYRAIENSYLFAVKNTYKSRVTFAFDIIKLIFTVLFLVLAAAALMMGTIPKMSYLITSLTLGGCASLLFVFSDALDKDMIVQLQRDGIYILNPKDLENISVIEKEEVFDKHNYSKYEVFSSVLKSVDARRKVETLKKKKTIKLRILIIAVINVICCTVFAATFTLLPVYFAIPLIAAITAVFVGI